MEELTKNQLVLLVLLVSFVTSLVTGIVTVSLLEQAPGSPITQTITRVVDKITPIEIPKSQQQQQASPVSILTKEDQIIKVVSDTSNAVVSVIASKDLAVVEQYFVNPFEGDEFFKNFPGLLPDVQIPQYRSKGIVKKQVSSGTGFFVSKDGILITNKHVVEDIEAEYSIVMNNGKKLEAKVLARDPFQDIAVLKVEKIDDKDFNFIPLGDSNGVKVGQSVIAIGNALGEFRNTVSVGIISGLNRSVTAYGNDTSEFLEELIQTDAAINPGNSGGPLLDSFGRVIGINTAVASSAENIGFALPINIAKRDINDAIQFGKIKYPYIGVRYQIVDNGIKLAKGQNGESAVISNSPAVKAGLKEGDIITELGGVKIDGQNTLGMLLNKYRIGDKIDLKVMRDGKEKQFAVVLEERPENL